MAVASSPRERWKPEAAGADLRSPRILVGQEPDQESDRETGPGPGPGFDLGLAGQIRG